MKWGSNWLPLPEKATLKNPALLRLMESRCIKLFKISSSFPFEIFATKPLFSHIFCYFGLKFQSNQKPVIQVFYTTNIIYWSVVNFHDKSQLRNMSVTYSISPMLRKLIKLVKHYLQIRITLERSAITTFE